MNWIKKGRTKGTWRKIHTKAESVFFLSFKRLATLGLWGEKKKTGGRREERLGSFGEGKANKRGCRFGLEGRTVNRKERKAL